MTTTVITQGNPYSTTTTTLATKDKKKPIDITTRYSTINLASDRHFFQIME